MACRVTRMPTRTTSVRSTTTGATTKHPPAIPTTKPPVSKLTAKPPIRAFRGALLTVTNKVSTTTDANGALKVKDPLNQKKLPGRTKPFVKVFKPSLHKKTVVEEALKAVGSSISQSKPTKNVIFVDPESESKKPKEEEESTLLDQISEGVEPMECSPIIDPKERLGFSSRHVPEDVIDIDAKNAFDPLSCSLYASDIYDYLRDVERQTPIRLDFFSNQIEVNGTMRGILIDWLVLLQLRFELTVETLYMTVAIIDRYLQETVITQSDLQLVGITAMFIASKYEEMYSPEVGDFVYLADDTYSKSQVLRTEQDILKKLNFRLCRPLPIHFLRRYSIASDCGSLVHNVAKYLMELSLMKYDLSVVPPSILAAAAIYVAIKALNDGSWDSQLVFYSTYSECDVLPVARKLCELSLKAETSKLQSVREKYSHRKLHKVSMLPVLTSNVVRAMANKCAISFLN